MVLGALLAVISVSYSYGDVSSTDASELPLVECAVEFAQDLVSLGFSRTANVLAILEDGLTREAMASLGPLLKEGQSYAQYLEAQTEPEQRRTLAMLALRVGMRHQAKLRKQDQSLFANQGAAIVESVRKQLIKLERHPDLISKLDKIRNRFDPSNLNEEISFLEKMPQWAINFHLLMVGDQWSATGLTRARLKQLNSLATVRTFELLDTFAARNPEASRVAQAKLKIAQACAPENHLFFIPAAHLWLALDTETLKTCGIKLLTDLRDEEGDTTLDNRVASLEFFYLRIKNLPPGKVRNGLYEALAKAFYGQSEPWYFARFEASQMPSSLYEARASLRLRLKPDAKERIRKLDLN